MGGDARSKFVLELVAEFVEDRVRCAPDESFSMDEVKRSLGTMLHEAEVAVDLGLNDNTWVFAWINQHPCL